MSDIDELLTARTQEEFEAKLEPWTRRVFRKWKTEGLTEREAWELLSIYGEVDAPTHAVRQHRLKVMFKKSGNPHGLLPAALFYGKDDSANGNNTPATNMIVAIDSQQRVVVLLSKERGFLFSE